MKEKLEKLEQFWKKLQNMKIKMTGLGTPDLRFDDCHAGTFNKRSWVQVTVQSSWPFLQNV